MHKASKRILVFAAVAFGAALAWAGAPALAQTQIFTDGFESGDLSAWSAAREQIPGSLAVTSAAAMNETSFGLEVAGGGLAGVVTREPARETDTGLFWFFSADNWEMASNARVEILRLYGPGRRHHLRLVLQRGAGGLRVAMLVRGNRGPYELIGSGLLAAGQENLIEVVWLAASTRNGTDGSATLWINGEIEAREPSLANGRLDVRAIELGLLGGNVRATRGSLYFDEFSAFRTLAP